MRMMLCICVWCVSVAFCVNCTLAVLCIRDHFDTFFVSLMLFHLSSLFCHVVFVLLVSCTLFFIVATRYSLFSCVLIVSGVAILAFWLVCSFLAGVLVVPF